MSNISASLPVYTPPPVAPVVSPDPTSNVSTQGDATSGTNADVTSNPAVATAATTPTNASDNTPATYTALGNESTSNIRGVTLNASV